MQFASKPSAIYMRELNEDGKSFKPESERRSILETDRISEQLIVEGPWMMKKDGKFYLFYSSGWVSMSSYHVGVAVADNIDEEIKAKL